MAQLYANINIKPIIYLKDSNGDFELDTNKDKIVVEECQSVNNKKCANILPTENFDYKISITEYGS